MKVKIVTYGHAENGISLQVIPETDEEEALLHGLWKHGRMELGHPSGEKGGIGFYVSWRQKGDGL